MTRAARRAASAAVTLALVSVVVFALASTLPGGEDEDESDHRLPADYRVAVRAQFHLDEPWHLRYVRWIGDLSRGDLGVSLREKRPVSSILRERLPVSLALNAAALCAIVMLAVPLGIAGAWRPASRPDRLLALGTTALYAAPVFWAALLLQWVFAVRLGWLPLYGAGRAAHLVLPVACLTYGGLAYVSRFVRTAIVEGTTGEGGRVARARGVGPLRFLLVHGLRQAAIPLLTLAGFLIPRLVGGSLLIEEIFGVPGLGSLMFQSVLARDLPVVLALTLLSGTVTLAAITGADVLMAWVDPRSRRVA
ncbi:MAG TPA: ABC transporter permease [Candidatus Polarisedimenticolaceae bacterium]|nr:ABC transporter permease [Candidatus Polarisedimenticolaceae bacterium]